jgi:hypothetical protein
MEQCCTDVQASAILNSIKKSPQTKLNGTILGEDWVEQTTLGRRESFVGGFNKTWKKFR